MQLQIYFDLKIMPEHIYTNIYVIKAFYENNKF